jgi:DNA (cytosine-5)-methyltransferase 1
VKPRLLDLFCGAGGAAMGYHRAGFDVVGVDIEPQPHYPFEFHQGNALAVLGAGFVGWNSLRDFDAIHASPPCQAYSVAAKYQRNAGKEYPDLIGPTRELLEATGLPWVIENVPGAPMRTDVMLCGSQFGLNVRRHRLFEFSEPPFQLMPPCVHDSHVVGPYGNPNAMKGSGKDWAAAMGIDWMTTPEMTQAIPPAYTEWIGAQLIRHLSVSAAPPVQEKP